MSDLIDGVAGIDPAVQKINVHHLMADICLYALGVFDGTAALQDHPDVANEPDALAQAQAIVAAIDAETGTANKILLARRITDVMMKLEHGSERYITGQIIDKTAVKDDAGF